MNSISPSDVTVTIVKVHSPSETISVIYVFVEKNKYGYIFVVFVVVVYFFLLFFICVFFVVVFFLFCFVVVVFCFDFFLVFFFFFFFLLKYTSYLVCMRVLEQILSSKSRPHSKSAHYAFYPFA